MMRTIRLALALTLVPALLIAQERTGAGAEVEARAKAKAAAEAAIPADFSAETRAELEAMVKAAAEKKLPTEPMFHTMAEGKAKGAAEARIVRATARTMARLEASQSALIQAGREQPSDEEVSRGAQVIARGATEAQLKAFVKKAPSDRSLVVAFEVLTELADKGLPVDNALLRVSTRLQAGATDAQLKTLPASIEIRGGGGASAGMGLGVGKRGATVDAAGTVTQALGIGVRRGG
jgi:hypothetical protein